MTLPTILERIVTQRRARYGVTSSSPLDFPFNESSSAFSFFSSREEEEKAFIEGKDEKQDERQDESRDEGQGEGQGERGDVAGTARDNAFLRAIEEGRGSAVIAEVKLGSPRLGSIAGRVDPERQARVYADHGAAALSVVVEPDFFFGSYELLRRCKSASGLPAVAKDFVVSLRQLDEAAAAGADAVLLISALYSDRELVSWARAARARGLAPLVETHDRDELERLAAAAASGGEAWELVGVNNRDLRTFAVDLERSIELRPLLPAAALAVAESGIESRADVRRLARAGFDAFLIGESLLLAPDPGAKLEELIG